MGEVYRQGGALCFRVDRSQTGLACRSVLALRLGLTERAAEQACREGLVRRGAAICQGDEILSSGDMVRAQIAAGPASSPTRSVLSPWQIPLPILYEDDHILVVDKPAGMIMYPGDADESCTLANAVTGYFEETGQDAYALAVHRLDRNTTGGCLFAKHQPALRILSMALEARRIERVYYAIVEGRVKSLKGTIDKPLGRDRHQAGKMRVCTSGMKAVTHFEVVETVARFSLLRLTLDTGRTHQIRVHMASVGHPLLGDSLYGCASSHIGRQALHAGALSLCHPYEGDRLSIFAPFPPDLETAALALGLKLHSEARFHA